MYEVYSSTKPGRPTLLLAVSACVLAGTLGAAWLQVRAARALGAEVRIPGTPLVVRPPKGWVAHPDASNTFVERGGPGWTGPLRQIQFTYQRWSGMRSIERMLQQRNYRESARATAPTLARVGPLDAVQVLRVRQFSFRGRIEIGQTVYRLAMSPRGDEVNVEYLPLRELTRGELELLDSICAAIRIDDASLLIGAEEAQQRAGVRFPLDENWRVFGPDFPDVRGLYVQVSDRGLPIFGMALFRTWLAPGRSAGDLLADFGGAHWPDVADELPGRSIRSIDERVTALLYPDPGRNQSVVASARLISEASDQAALLIVYADRNLIEIANEAADALAGSLEFVGDAFPQSLSGAVRSGEAFVRELHASGPSRRWGAEPLERFYVGQSLQAPEYRQAPIVFREERAPDRESPGAYSGQHAADTRQTQERWAWWLDARGRAYRWRSEHHIPGQDELTIIEERLADQDQITQQIKRGRRRKNREYEVGPSFVCPPAEALAEAHAALERDTLLIEVSTRLGRGTHSRLLLPVEGRAGVFSVLLIDDSAPHGTLLELDEHGRLHRQAEPSFFIEHTDPDSVNDLLRRWGR